MSPSLPDAAEGERGQEPITGVFVPCVETVPELAHSLSSSGTSCPARVRTQVTLPLGPGGGRQRLISFPPRAGPNANCLLVPNAIFCTIEHVPYLGQREAKASLGSSLWFEVEV